jgi:magnesium transporter
MPGLLRAMADAAVLKAGAIGSGSLSDLAQVHISKTELLWALGVTVAIVAQFISNLGTILQKRSHNDESYRPIPEQRPYTKRPLWWVGMSLILFGSVADFVALTLAPQSVVATLGCLTLVAQVVWAPLILGERLGVRHYIATGMIIIGVVLAVVYGPHSEGHFSLAQLLARFQTLGFGIYVVGVFVTVLTLYGLISYVESRFDLPSKPRLSDYVSRPTATLTNAASNERRRAWDARLARFHRVAYGMLSGVIGAQVVLLGKFIGELIAILVGGGDTGIFTTPATYIILVTLAGAVIGQIHFMNEGVSRFQSLYILPVFQAAWTLTSVVGGLVVFDEWAAMNSSLKRQILFPFGILLTLFAVYYLMHTPALPEDNKRKSACIDRLLGGGPPKGGNNGGVAAGGLPSSPVPGKGSRSGSDLIGKGGSIAGAGLGQNGGSSGPADSSDVSTPAKLAGGDNDIDEDAEGSSLMASTKGKQGRGGLDPVPPTGGKQDGRAGGNSLVLPPENDKKKGVDWSRTCNEIWSLHLPEADDEKDAAAAAEEEKNRKLKTMKSKQAGLGAQGSQQQLTRRGSPSNNNNTAGPTIATGRSGGIESDNDVYGVLGGVGGLTLSDTAFYLSQTSSSSSGPDRISPLSSSMAAASPPGLVSARGGSRSGSTATATNNGTIWSSAVSTPAPPITTDGSGSSTNGGPPSVL